jgi:NAD(P) transhydrogenase
MKTLDVNLAVIGAGPAGQKGAIQGAKAGKKVVVIDRLGLLGGACLNQGTIPSKTLRRAILDLTGFLHSAYFGGSHRTLQEISINDLSFRVNKVIEDENALLQKQCEANGIEVAYGSARFVDEHAIEILGSEGQVTCLVRTEKVLISTGSRPRHPIDIPDDKELFLDSDQVFRMQRLPESLIVLGGGIIGCEYATMFAALGVRVTLMERRNQLLRMLDAEIGQLFAEYIRQLGVEVSLGHNIQELRASEDQQAEVVLDNGECIRSPCLFYSMGRVANVEGLNLQAAGIELDALGNIPVNKLFQTACPNIYAAGDVIGPPGLASTSLEQGRLAVRNALTLKSHHFPDFFPYGIYTIPEISSIGPTEEELQEQGVHYEVGRAYYYEIARGPIAGDTTGMFKLIFHSETLELLGVHIIGTDATELIPLGQMAIHFHARVDYFVNNIFNYPTFAEGYRVAALNGLNKLREAGAGTWS